MRRKLTPPDRRKSADPADPPDDPLDRLLRSLADGDGLLAPLAEDLLERGEAASGPAAGSEVVAKMGH